MELGGLEGDYVTLVEGTVIRRRGTVIWRLSLGDGGLKFGDCNLEGGALRKCLVDIFSERARRRDGRKGDRH